MQYIIISYLFYENKKGSCSDKIMLVDHEIFNFVAKDKVITMSLNCYFQ